MTTWVFVASTAGVIAIIFLLIKSIELNFGLPRFYENLRTNIDSSLESALKRNKIKSYRFGIEVKDAVMRTPHMFIHLALIIRDRLRGRFSHYIDEVKGRKPIKVSQTNSEYLSAVKEHKDTNAGGLIE